MFLDFLGFVGAIWCLQSQEKLVLGFMDMSSSSEKHENNGFFGM